MGKWGYLGMGGGGSGVWLRESEGGFGKGIGEIGAIGNCGEDG